MGYFRNNRDKMEYAGYHASGLIISSGPVEAAAKTIVATDSNAAACDGPATEVSRSSPTSPGAIETMGCFLELVSPADHAHNNPEKGSVKTRLHPLQRKGRIAFCVFPHLLIIALGNRNAQVSPTRKSTALAAACCASSVPCHGARRGSGQRRIRRGASLRVHPAGDDVPP